MLGQIYQHHTTWIADNSARIKQCQAVKSFTGRTQETKLAYSYNPLA